MPEFLHSTVMLYGGTLTCYMVVFLHSSAMLYGGTQVWYRHASWCFSYLVQSCYMVVILHNTFMLYGGIPT